METLRVENWENFKTTIADLREQYTPSRRKLQNGKTYARLNQILFRGQADASWSLQTTLERATGRQFNVLDYLVIAMEGLHEVESFSGHRWNIEGSFDLLKVEIEKNQHSFRLHLPSYDYLVYLRHHGFPRLY